MTSRRDRKFPHEPGGDAPRPPSSELAAPSDAGQAPALRAPLETIAHAMKTQADLLRQMHERQRALEDAVRDERRHELTINSAQALNDSFRGLQQTQERLAERLAETQGPSKARAAWIAALVVAVLGAGAAGAWALRRGADDLGDMVKSLEKPRVDEDARAALKALEARVGGVEATDRAAFQGELDRLRRVVEGAQAERETLRRERDQAREETGVLRGRLADAERDGGEARAKLEALEKENARLSTQSVADRRLLTQLN
ncbi:MAG TPA: hypothetical protein VEI02_10050, partial [Planctomycetota bacterium]|nr:hypothetical protein [Planctomycetota bacterium]